MVSTLHDLLRRAARAGGDRLAVVDGARSLTYAELDRRSDQLARLLIRLGVAPGDRVGLYLDRSVDSVVGLYGALKAGAAYVPLDPTAPVRRLAYIIGNCGIQVLLTGAEKQESWADLREAGAPVRALVVLNAAGAKLNGKAQSLPVHGSGAIDRQDPSPPNDPTISVDLAYILYTSGSTGDPKGVMLSHRNALAFVEWAVEEFGVTAEDRLSGHAPLHFDLSVFDLFAAAWAGAALVLVPSAASIFPFEVARFMRSNGITIWYSVPSILSMLALRGGLAPGDLPSLRTVLFAGEVFPTPYLRRLMQLLPNARFANLYGPTETNVCTWYDVRVLEDDAQPIPIGRAIKDVEVFAVTDDGRKARPGEVGEILVRGPTVMRGYWGDSTRTSKGLVPNPLRQEALDVVYRTGDLGVQDRDGNWRYLGRRDGQIKSRGYRIELGEIEATLYAHAGVTECAAVAVADELVTNRIKAYVVSRERVDERALAEFCAQRLPRYMVPELWEFRDALPRTSTGKVDRRSLSDVAR
jgi:amino acid adenylation domain-containing protein